MSAQHRLTNLRRFAPLCHGARDTRALRPRAVCLQDKVGQLEAELASTREALKAAQRDREAALAAESAALEQAAAAQTAQATAEERALQHAEERERAEQESARARVDAQR